MIEEIKLGKYKHYKGNFYQVLGITVHSETLEEFVLYKPLYISEDKFKGKYWIRPKSMFLEEVEVNAKKVKRFEYISD